MWQQTQILHVFQEQLVTGKSSHKGDNNMDPIVDLRSLGSFEEVFYLVVLEKNAEGVSTLHMWKITISSSQTGGSNGECLSSSLTVFGEELRYCYSLGIVVIVVVFIVQKLWHFIISLITEDIYLKLEVCVHIQREIHTIKGDNSKCIFFLELCPFFCDLGFLSSIKHPTAEHW